MNCGMDPARERMADAQLSGRKPRNRKRTGVRPTCPRCKLELAGKTHHETPEDCLSDLVPRFTMLTRARKAITRQLDYKQRQLDNWRLRCRALENELKALRSGSKRDIAGRVARLEGELAELRRIA